jgi:hypothetical protein
MAGDLKLLQALLFFRERERERSGTLWALIFEICGKIQLLFLFENHSLCPSPKPSKLLCWVFTFLQSRNFFNIKRHTHPI